MIEGPIISSSNYSTATRRGTFNVVQFKNPQGSAAYRVVGTKHDGKRVRQNYPTKEEARARVEELEIEEGNIDVGAMLKRTWLSYDQLREAESAFQRMDGTATLDKVVNHFLETYSEPVSEVTLKDALAQFTKTKENANARPLTIQNLKVRIKRLVKGYPAGTMVSSVLPEHIRKAINRPDLKPATRNNELRAFRTFFRWAKRQGLISKDPTESIESVRQDETEPEVLALPEVRALLSAAQAVKDGALVPYISLCLFAALRPTETQRLTWEDIDFKEKAIIIKGAHAKLRKRRRVEMSPNLIAWLKSHKKKSGNVTPPTNFRRNFDAVKFLAGWRGDRDSDSDEKRPVWVTDIMRHTAISNHFTQFKHEGETATWAGTSPTMLHKRYRGLITVADAKGFWKLAPDSGAPTPATAIEKKKVS